MNDDRMRICSRCDHQASADMKFCPQCGTTLGSTHNDTPGASPDPTRTTPVFALGLLSVLCFAPLGILGWALSMKGTSELRSGTAAKSGLFAAGKVMSVIGTSLTVVGAVILVLLSVSSFFSRAPEAPATTAKIPASPIQSHPQSSSAIEETSIDLDGVWECDGKHYSILETDGGTLIITRLGKDDDNTYEGIRHGSTVVIRGEWVWQNVHEHWEERLKLLSKGEMRGKRSWVHKVDGAVNDQGVVPVRYRRTKEL